ncbi:MAG: transporter substrate-binding domain-containing protein [Pseudomonadota bacterium]
MNTFTQHVKNGARLLGAAALFAAATAALGQQARLPANFQSTKVIRTAVQNQYPPLNYSHPETRKLSGLNIDLLEAIGAKLGVKMEMVETSFAQMTPGLDSGRFDFIGTGIGDFPARRETLTLVNYLQQGPQLIALQEKAGSFKTPADLCGKSVGHVRFVASFGVVLKALSESECVAKGKPAIVAVTDDLPVMLGLVQNRYDAALIASELYPWLVQTEKSPIARIGQPLRTWYLALGFRKQDTALRDAIAAALSSLIQDGTYAKILARYKLSELAVKDVSIDVGEF